MSESLLPLTVFVVLVFAAWRITRFFVLDSLIGFNLASESRTSERLDAWAYDDEGRDRSFLRGKVGDLLTCIYCLGFWISLAVYAAWAVAVDWQAPFALHVLNVFAVAGGQIVLGSTFDGRS